MIFRSRGSSALEQLMAFPSQAVGLDLFHIFHKLSLYIRPDSICKKPSLIHKAVLCEDIDTRHRGQFCSVSKVYEFPLDTRRYFRSNFSVSMSLSICIHESQEEHSNSCCKSVIELDLDCTSVLRSHVRYCSEPSLAYLVIVSHQAGHLQDDAFRHALGSHRCMT